MIESSTKKKSISKQSRVMETAFLIMPKGVSKSVFFEDAVMKFLCIIFIQLTE